MQHPRTHDHGVEDGHHGITVAEANLRTDSRVAGLFLHKSKKPFWTTIHVFTVAYSLDPEPARARP